VEHYPGVIPEKVIVARLGVEIYEQAVLPVPRLRKNGELFTVLAVGRLHSVKDHAFLVRACAQLRLRNLPFECLIAGDGPEWRNLSGLIRELDLAGSVTLLGHVAREKMTS